MNDRKKMIYSGLAKVVEWVAREKAGHNCWGLLYEPKRPEVLINTEAGKR